MNKVEIVWLDTVAESKWNDIKDVKKEEPARIINIGYVVKRTKEKIILCSAYSEKKEDRQCDYTVIPMGVVIDIKEIK